MRLLLFDAIMYALPYARAFQMAVYLFMCCQGVGMPSCLMAIVIGGVSELPWYVT